jgi:hypothetical protein
VSKDSRLPASCGGVGVAGSTNATISGALLVASPNIEHCHVTAVLLTTHCHEAGSKQDVGMAAHYC